MGKKAIYIVCGLGVLAGMLQIIGALLPMHKLGLNIFGAKLFCFVNTHLTSVVVYNANRKYDDQVSNLIKVAQPTATKTDTHFFDSDFEGTHNLEDIRFHMCTPVLKLTWPGLCDGFDAAYGTGIAVIVCLVTNLLCQCIGCYLMYDYSTRKQNPQYREIAASMILAGGGIMFMVLIGYYFAALDNMNNMNGSLLANIVFQPSDASGATSGYIVLIVALILQILQGVLILSFTKNEFGEDEYWDKKEAREAGLELTHVGGGGGGFGMQGGMQPGGGMMMTGPQVVMQPMGMGMQPMAMQPMGQPMMNPGAPAW